MGLSDHVSITITAQTTGVSRPGFGTPLILSGSAPDWTEYVRSYTGIDGVADDFDSGTPEYRAAAAVFAQSPHPRKVKIGRSTGPQIRYNFAVNSVKNAHTYSIEVELDDGTSETVTYLSDGTALNDEIVSNLVTNLNAVVGKNYTATVDAGGGDTDTFHVIGTAAGDWFSFEIDPTYLSCVQVHGDADVDDALDAIVGEDDDWYCLITLYNSSDYMDTAADWIEGRKKIYIADNNDSAEVTAGTGGLSDLKDEEYTRTAPFYHTSPAQMAAASWAGRCLPLDPGSETWKFKKLNGLPANVFTDTWRGRLIADNINFYQAVAGASITQEGTMADGGFIDLKRFLDWFESEMATNVFQVLINNEKIPYTDAGVAMIEAAVRATLRKAIARGGIAEDPAPEVTAPLVADIDATDKANRLLPDVRFTATFAGAVHTVEISGTISV